VLRNYSLTPSGCSTSLCTGVLNQVVDRYTHGGSHVFAGFLDFRKAFDSQLLETVPEVIG